MLSSFSEVEHQSLTYFVILEKLNEGMGFSFIAEFLGSLGSMFILLLFFCAVLHNVELVFQCLTAMNITC